MWWFENIVVVKGIWRVSCNGNCRRIKFVVVFSVLIVVFWIGKEKCCLCFLFIYCVVYCYLVFVRLFVSV